jgi:O-antigen/teichoic acid export membrane protein
VLNFLLVPGYGYTAAATTTLISYIFLLTLTIIASRRFFIWHFPFKSLVKVVCASGVMAIVVYFAENAFTFSASKKLILGPCIGIMVYLSMLFLLKEPLKKEIETLQIIRDKVLRRGCMTDHG